MNNPLSLQLAPQRWAVGALLAFFLVQTATAAIAIKSGDKIAFLGDSITEAGWGNPFGYVRLVLSGLEANQVKAEAVPAVISGHKTNDMLARLQRDVLSKNPQWMTLSCGVNDVWHGKNGVALNEAALTGGIYGPEAAARGTYQKNMAAIVDQARGKGIEIVMLTSTVIHEKLSNPENAKLALYNDTLRTLAQEKKLRMADLNALFQQRIQAENKPDQMVLTNDGVHMAFEGDKLMARGVLQAMGLNGSQLKKAEQAWAMARQAADDAKKATKAAASK